MIVPMLKPAPNALVAHSQMMQAKTQPRSNVVMMAHGKKPHKMGYNQFNKFKMHQHAKKGLKWHEDIMPKEGDSFSFDATQAAQQQALFKFKHEQGMDLLSNLNENILKELDAANAQLQQSSLIKRDKNKPTHATYKF